MKKRILSALAVVAGIGFLASCTKKDKQQPLIHDVPSTYNFSNANYDEASQAIAMWSGFIGYLGKSTDRRLSQDTVNYLWNNTGNAFKADYASDLKYTPDQLNSFTGVKLSALTANATEIKDLADSMVKISAFYSTAGGEGIAGKQSTRLFNYAGLEFNQAVAKGMMGAMVFSKIMAHLDKSKAADNKNSTAKGTAMEHEWDMAFGYVGIPQENFIDRSKNEVNTFPKTDPNRPLALGGYFKERGAYIKSGQKVYDAFIKGRAAIGAKDYATRDAAIATIAEYLEKTIAAALWNYTVTPSKPGSGDPIIARALRLHGLSEGYGFVIALKHRPTTSKLTAANLNTISSIMNKNFYDLLKNADADRTNSDLMKVKPILEAAYGRLQDPSSD